VTDGTANPTGSKTKYADSLPGALADAKAPAPDVNSGLSAGRLQWPLVRSNALRLLRRAATHAKEKWSPLSDGLPSD